jgi:hypothetical protein
VPHGLSIVATIQSEQALTALDSAVTVGEIIRCTIFRQQIVATLLIEGARWLPIVLHHRLQTVLANHRPTFP